MHFASSCDILKCNNTWAFLARSDFTCLRVCFSCILVRAAHGARDLPVPLGGLTWQSHSQTLEGDSNLEKKNPSGGSFDFSLQDFLEASSPAWRALHGVELDFRSPQAWRTLLNYRRLKPVSCRVMLRARVFLFIINNNPASVLPSGLCLHLLL